MPKRSWESTRPGIEASIDRFIGSNPEWLINLSTRTKELHEATILSAKKRASDITTRREAYNNGAFVALNQKEIEIFATFVADLMTEHQIKAVLAERVVPGRTYELNYNLRLR